MSYMHAISFVKLKGIGHDDFGVGDEILAVVVSFISHVFGCFFAIIVVYVFSALIVFVKDVSGHNITRKKL